jgi:hypothetical protein
LGGKLTLAPSPTAVLDAFQRVFGRLAAALTAGFCYERHQHELSCANGCRAEMLANLLIDCSAAPHLEGGSGTLGRHEGLRWSLRRGVILGTSA